MNETNDIKNRRQVSQVENRISIPLILSSLDPQWAPKNRNLAQFCIPQTDLEPADLKTLAAGLDINPEAEAKQTLCNVVNTPRNMPPFVVCPRSRIHHLFLALMMTTTIR